MDTPKGLVYENGVLIKYTSYGRKRKNWKQDYRQRSRNKLKYITNCKICGSTEKLTVHHRIPLRQKVDISRENLIKVCRDCHDKIERGEIKLPTPEYVIIDDENIQKFIESIKGYGINIDINNEEVIIKIPQGKGFYESFIGPIAKESSLEEQQAHGV